LPNEKFNKPIDMEFDELGNMYVLEYGANYFANNIEAKLVKIEYNRGNRLPHAVIQATETKGSAPFKVDFFASQSYDYDLNDTLIYDWTISDGREARGEHISLTFDSVGIYEIGLKVTDRKGAAATSSLPINVGNEPPEINLILEGNQSFYFGERQRNYQVEVADLEDGSLSSGTIDPREVKINFSYLSGAHDLALLGEAFYKNADLPIAGKQLIEGSDCSSCHAMESASIGPSFNQIAERYEKSSDNISMLAMKIIQGGNGNWGHSLMAAHPDLSTSDAESMVEYILSVKDKNNLSSLPVAGIFLDKNNLSSLPVAGIFLLDEHQSRTDKGIYAISVGYEDHGNEVIPAIEASKIQFLRAPCLEAENYDVFKNVEQQRPNGGSFAYVSSLKHGSYVGFDNIDLSGVGEIAFKILPISGGKIALYHGGFDREPLAELSIPSAEKGPSWVEENFVEYNFTIDAVSDASEVLYFLFSDADNMKVDMNLDQIIFKQR